MQAGKFDIDVVPGQRVDYVLRWQVKSSKQALDLAPWTPVMLIENEGNVLYSNLGDEPDFQVTKSATELGRMDLYMGFEFTSGLYRPYDSAPQLRYRLELVDNTLNTNTIPLLNGFLILSED